MAPAAKPSYAASHYWGAVLASAMERETTAALWGRINRMRAQTGASIPRATFGEISSLRANAVAMARASRELSAAPPESAVLPEHISHPWYGRARTGAAYRPSYQGRFEMRTLTGGVLSKAWYRIDFGSLLPATIAALRSDVELYASALADAYASGFVDLGRVMIEEV